MTLTVKTELTRNDAEALAWWIGENFKDQADANADGTVSLAEAQSWVNAKFSEMIGNFIRRANEAREKEAPADLPTDYKAALAKFHAAKAELEALRDKK